MELFEIISFWKETGIKLNNGASQELISQIETNLQFVFPDSFKNFYSTINGFKDWDTTPNLFYIWPLEKILKERDEYDEAIGFIPFCDFLINSHSLSFLKDKQGIFKSYSTETSITLTFEEAFELIYIDSILVY